MTTTSPWSVRGLRFLAVLSLPLVLSGCAQSEDTSEPETISVSILIHVGDEDSRWFRDVKISKGTDAYELTEKVTEGNMKATYYAEYRTHFVDAIFGVASKDPSYWLSWVWSESQNQWEPLPVGADLYSLKEGHILAWFYADTSQTDNMPPVTP